MRRLAVFVAFVGTQVGCDALISENAFAGRWRVALHEVEWDDAEGAAENSGVLDCGAVYVSSIPSPYPVPDGPPTPIDGCAAFLSWDLASGEHALAPVVDPPLRPVTVGGDTEDLDALEVTMDYAGAPALFLSTEYKGRVVELRAEGLTDGASTFDVSLFLTKD